jgi:hypothetical protein
MLKKLSFAFVILIALASCKSKSAFNYSQNFVQKERSLNMDLTESKVKGFFSSEQYDSIGAIGERMEKMVDTKIKEIEDEPAPDVKEGANFKKAGIEYFQFIKSLYASYKEYGYAKPEEREEKFARISALTDKEAVVIGDIQRAQQKYADANGFKIENK